MNVKVLLIGLFIAAIWPFVLTPRWFSLTVDPSNVLAVAKGGSLPTPLDCYYFTLFGDRYSESCPPKVPAVEVLYRGYAEIVDGRIVPSKPAVTVLDQVAPEILVPIEVRFILGVGLLSGRLRAAEENGSPAQGGSLGLKDL